MNSVSHTSKWKICGPWCKIPPTNRETLRRPEETTLRPAATAPGVLRGSRNTRDSRGSSDKEECSRKRRRWTLRPLRQVRKHPTTRSAVLRNSILMRQPISTMRFECRSGVNDTSIFPYLANARTPEEGKLGCTLQNRDFKTPTVLSVELTFHRIESEERDCFT